MCPRHAMHRRAGSARRHRASTGRRVANSSHAPASARAQAAHFQVRICDAPARGSIRAECLRLLQSQTRHASPAAPTLLNRHAARPGNECELCVRALLAAAGTTSWRSLRALSWRATASGAPSKPSGISVGSASRSASDHGSFCSKIPMATAFYAADDRQEQHGLVLRRVAKASTRRLCGHNSQPDD